MMAAFDRVLNMVKTEGLKFGIYFHSVELAGLFCLMNCYICTRSSFTRISGSMIRPEVYK